MKIEKLTDVAGNLEHPIMQEVFNSLEGQAGEEVICFNCKTPYIRGVCNFYNLCNPCFKLMDEEKTRQRWEFLKGLGNE